MLLLAAHPTYLTMERGRAPTERLAADDPERPSACWTHPHRKDTSASGGGTKKYDADARYEQERAGAIAGATLRAPAELG